MSRTELLAAADAISATVLNFELRDATITAVPAVIWLYILVDRKRWAAPTS